MGSAQTFAALPHMRHALRTKLIFWFAAMSIILVALTVLIFQCVTQLISASRWVEHTYQVLDTLDLTAARFLDAQSAERGYIATCNRALLLPYRSDMPRVYSDVAYLRLLTADNPGQQNRLETLHSTINAEFSRMSTAIAAAANGDVKRADAMISDRDDRVNVQKILRLTQEMQTAERKLLASRVGNVNFFASATLFACGVGMAGCLAILGFVFWLVRRETKQREVAQAKLYETNERLQGSLADLQLHGDAARSIALLGELLQTCRNTGEALALTARHLVQLIPGITGTIGLFNNSRDLIEAIQPIGNSESFASEFAPDECWGLRRGRTHHAGGTEPVCTHLPGEPRDLYCLPMIAQGDTLGVLSVGSHHGFSDVELQTIQTIAEQLSLALANLRLQESLRHQSLRDPLTGLFNRRYLEDALAREVARMRRRSEPLSVVMIDIDHFKRFNDTHGHQGGDALLAEFGLLLARHGRDEDIACRYGGEEFALVLPGASAAVAQQRADQLREAVKRLHVRLNGQSLGLVTMSAGVASYPANGSNANAVVGEADAALYRAKQRGRDRVEVAGNGDTAAAAAQSAAR